MGRISSSAGAAAATTSYLVWQDRTTGPYGGSRGFWSMAGTSYQGDWISLWNVTREWTIAALADFTGDLKPDIVWQNLTTGEIGFWPLNGTTWTGQYIGLWFLPLEWRVAAAADMTGDGKPDIILQDTNTGERGLWVMDGTARTGYVLLYPTTVDTKWDIAAAADMTGDGNTDLVWQNTTSGERGIWPYTNTTYSGEWIAAGTIPKEWDITAAADLTKSGTVHLVWRRNDTGQNEIWDTDYPPWQKTPIGLTSAGTNWNLAGVLLYEPPAPPPNPTTAIVLATPNNVFDPSSVTIAPGGTVTWRFGSVPHNVFFDPVAGAPADITGNNANVDRARTFAQAGTFPYECRIHIGMSGTVNVF